MKTQTKVAIAAITIFIGGIIFAGYKESQINYLDITCPACMEHQVLDLGQDTLGRTCGHCLGCGADVTITMSHDTTTD